MFVRRHLRQSLLCLGLAIGIPTSFAKLFNSPSEWRNAAYDYVIVGGGTAGSVLATRLTENPNVRVLPNSTLRNVGVLASEVPLLAPTLPGTVYDWNYTTTPQLDYMLYSLASLDDWNRYAEVSGDPAREFVPPAVNDTANGTYLPASHGYRGELGGNGNILGVGWIQTTIGNGTRSSAATCYLQPVIERVNLDVIINAHVTKLIQTGKENILPSFRSVQFAQTPTGQRYTASAKQEVILSAGSIGTPTFSNSRELAAGIRTIVNNPSFNAAMAEWNATRTGPLTHPLNSFVGWMRIPDNSSIYQTAQDPSAGPHSAHFEMLFGDRFSILGQSVPQTGHFLRIATGLISPSSRGTVNIVSSNPFDAPAINPNFLTTNFDIFTMIESVKTVKRFISAPAWDGYIISAYGALAEANSDADIETFVRATAGTIYHPVGTAAMSPKGASWGVVDPDLKMKGVAGVRIVDGSVLPYVPSSHAQGPIYLYAERASDIIKGEWLPSDSCVKH
ncbi:hypothetical protein BDQ17DRAFT_1371178 [Cyathus striatus]|nr:hypothetical protein BDQ17DRAFT_1371178 [Cyathus striatus]